MVLGGEMPGAEASSPLDYALDQFVTSLDHLIKVVEDGGLDSCDNSQFVWAMQAFEKERNRMPLVDHRMIADAATRNLPEVLTQGAMTRMLTSVLRLSPAEASRRVRAAEAVGDRVSMLGQTLDPVRPILAAAQRAGEVSTEQVAIIERALAGVDRRGFDPADLEVGERLLTEHAAIFGPKQLRILADRVVDDIDPDGTLPKETLNVDRRFLRLHETSDGAYAGEFRLTGECGVKLQALLGPLAKPRINTTVDADGRLIEQPDARHHGQRMHDALEDLCDRLLRTDAAVPDAGGTPATVIITINLDDLLAKTGYGVSSDGTLIRTDTVRRMVDQAEVYYAFLTARGQVVRLGRTRRIATRAQTCALIARDAGCSFPGCDAAPEWSERHHIIPWIDGGETDLDNLTLLCRYHHHNFATRGWECAINADGLPEWRPPQSVDRDQKPLINHRITGQLTAQGFRKSMRR